MPTDPWWRVLLLVIVLLWLIWAWYRRQQFRPSPAAVRRQRLLKPRTPDDCPACRRQSALPVATTPPPPVVTPWCEVKSRRGTPKRIDTQGFACLNRRCAYYRITDAQIHALVGDGVYGRRERIQTLRCQACGATFSTRRDTPLYRLKTASQRVAEVLTALAEGLSLAATVRVFGHRHTTITTWLTRAGAHSAMLHDRVFRRLHLPHIQFDELRTRLRNRTSTLWLWLALDPLTKIIPVLQLGARTQAAAHTVVHELYGRLASGCLPVYTSDALNLYFYALTAHFGQWMAGVGRRARRWQVAAGLIYGQVKKRYQRRRLVGVIYVMRCGTREALRSALRGLGLSGKLNTAFVERVNLTLRQMVAALIRRTWSTMQETPQLLLHLEWWRTYYHLTLLANPIQSALARQSVLVALVPPLDPAAIPRLEPG